MFNPTSPLRRWLRRHSLSRIISVKWSDGSSSYSNRKCWIFLLPDELLIEIFEYLKPRPSMQRVCQRWNRVYDSFMVRHIDLGTDGWSTSRRIKGLHAKLKRYPELCTHVRSISIQLRNPDAYPCEAIAPIITLCVALQGITLHTEWNVYIWPIVHAISKLAALETLSLKGFHRAVPLEVVFDYFNHPSLRRLHLDYYGVRDTEPSMITCPPAELAMGKLPERAGKHISGVTELTLMDPATTPEATECVVRRSLRLVKLTFKNKWASNCGKRYTGDAVQRILDIHAPSLTHIDFDVTLSNSLIIPNFRTFTCLRVLRLSAQAVFDLTPEAVSRSLSTPSLQHLIIAYSTCFCQSTVLWHQSPQVNIEWLQNFATRHLAIEGTKLCSIMIDFTPDCINHSCLVSDVIWHWEHLIEAKNPLSEYGIALGCKKPVCPSEE